MIEVKTVVGENVVRYLPDFARLSDECLAGWPFFIRPKNDGGKQLIASLSSVSDRLHAVVVTEGDAVVGGTYGHPMHTYLGQLSANVSKIRDISRVYWIAQTTILPAYQGRGISHQIYNARDPWIIASGQYDAIAHVLVIRPDDHPMKPASHVPYDEMWGKRGYRHLVGMDVQSTFADALDNPKKPTEKTLQIWIKDLT